MARKKKERAKKPQTEEERVAEIERNAAAEFARECAALDSTPPSDIEPAAPPAFPVLPHTPSSDILEIAVPSVWREDGYLVLAYKIWADEVHYFSLLNGERAEKPDAFLARMSCKLEEVCPHQFALNLLARLRMGTCQMRAKTERILAAMLNTEKLNDMSERALASEYKKVMGKGPDRIKESAKAERIAEMLAKLKTDAAKTTDGDAAPETKPPKEKTVKATKTKATKPAKEAKAKPAKETKAKPAAKTTAKAAKANGESPFRAGTMKARGYEFFLTHKDDADACRAYIEKLGAAPGSARGWISTYRKAAG